MLPYGAIIKPCLCGVALVLGACFATVVTAQDAPTSGVVAPPVETNSALERVRQLLAAVEPTLIKDEALGDVATTELTITISLSEKRLHLFAGEKEALSCPIACGFAGRATPRGKFTVVAVEENKKMPDRGVYVRGKGEVLVADIDRRWDPMPSGTSFLPVPVAVLIRLDGDGPTIQSGLPTESGTTSGDVRIPASAAAALARYLKKGTQVEIK